MIFTVSRWSKVVEMMISCTVWRVKLIFGKVIFLWWWMHSEVLVSLFRLKWEAKSNSIHVAQLTYKLSQFCKWMWSGEDCSRVFFFLPFTFFSHLLFGKGVYTKLFRLFLAIKRDWLNIPTWNFLWTPLNSHSNGLWYKISISISYSICYSYVVFAYVFYCF